MVFTGLLNPSEKKRGNAVPRGYQSYRGKRSAAVKLLIAVLVLILIAACSFLFIQRFVTYTDDGQLRLDLPSFLQGLFHSEEVSSPENHASPPSNTVSTSGDQEDQTDSQNVKLIIEPPAEPEPPAPEKIQRNFVQLAEIPADAAALSETLAASGANGFVWRVRENTGVVRYASNVSLKDAIADNAADPEALSGLCSAAEGNAVALFNCFHDSYYAFVNMESAGICQNTGYIWYDNLNYHWLDPAKQKTREYVVALALECAQLGFDELLLEDMAYPSSGKLHKIDYSMNTLGKTEALSQFLSELRTALEPYGVRLSLLLSEDLILAGSNQDSGQDLAALLPSVDAVYARVSDAAAVQAALDAAAGAESAPVLVPLVDVAQEGDWCVLQD